MVAVHCICDLLPKLTLSTHLTLVMHQREWSKTTNTGHLALRSLTRSGFLLWGEEDNQAPPAPESIVMPGTRGYVLAPSGLPLTPERVAIMKQTPITLVVTDGSWRQATKMTRRIPVLRDLTRIALPPGPLSEYRLRSEPHPEGLATFEAIARTLGHLEGPEVQQALERPFLEMVRRTLMTRGEHERADSV